MFRHPRALPSRLGLLMIGMLLLTLALSACTGAMDIREDLTVYDDNSYEGTATVVVPAQAVQQGGGTASVVSQVERQLDQDKNGAAAQGIQEDWKRVDLTNPGDLSYQITVRGDDYSQLRSKGIAIQPTTYQGKQVLALGFIPSSAYRDRQFTLHAASVLQANGSTTSDAVSWHNSPTMQAVFTPRGRLSVARLAPWAAGLVVLAVVGYLLLSRQRLATTSARSPGLATGFAGVSGGGTPSNVFCPQCGAANADTSRHCTRCGSVIPPRAV